ncbi:MAG TPA: hypothetical protein VNH82_02630 [Candidatus Dormibacteraeota bacterium]|nr:hypothetical protein [Candidatus Dormibacteraeota bacterium]
MNHLLFGFALCAALAIYPGGLAVLVAALAGGLAPFALGRREGWAGWAARPGNSTRLLLGLALAGLVVAPMPWPDNPVSPIGISWAAGSSLGGIALSLSALWALQLLGSKGPWPALVLVLLGIWSMGLLLLALAVHTVSWSGVLDAAGLGAELGRLGLAVLGIACLPLALGGGPGGLSLRSAAWAAGVGMALLLALPQLQTVPFPVAFGAWWVLMAILGLVWSAGARWGQRFIRNLGLVLPAATLNAP